MCCFLIMDNDHKVDGEFYEWILKIYRKQLPKQKVIILIINELMLDWLEFGCVWNFLSKIDDSHFQSHSMAEKLLRNFTTFSAALFFVLSMRVKYFERKFFLINFYIFRDSLITIQLRHSKNFFFVYFLPDKPLGNKKIYFFFDKKIHFLNFQSKSLSQFKALTWSEWIKWRFFSFSLNRDGKFFSF